MVEEVKKIQLLEIIKSITKKEENIGLISIFELVKEVEKLLHLSLSDCHKVIIELENENRIYLESINDITRLSQEQKFTAINDSVRGFLYYVGVID